MTLPINPHLRVTAHETATTIPCGYCGARADQPCITRSGLSTEFPHVKRIRARYRQLVKSQPKPQPQPSRRITMSMTITTEAPDQDAALNTNLAIWWAGWAVQHVASRSGAESNLGDTCHVLLDTPLDGEWLFLDDGKQLYRATWTRLGTKMTDDYEWVLSVPTGEPNTWEIMHITRSEATITDREGKPMRPGRVVQFGDEEITYCLVCDHNPCECK